MPSKKLTSADDVIDALGGTMATSRITGSKPTAVSNWRVRGLPSAKFRIMQRELEQRGLKAPSTLWGIDEPTVAQ